MTPVDTEVVSTQIAAGGLRGSLQCPKTRARSQHRPNSEPRGRRYVVRQVRWEASEKFPRCTPHICHPLVSTQVGGFGNHP